MSRINPFFLSLSTDYLFPEIQKKAAFVQEKNPSPPLINLGIGDTTLPIPKTIITAICFAAKELQEQTTFKGYGSSQGELFLRKAISATDYQHQLSEDEIFISCGTKNDISRIQELFSSSICIGIPDPSYPVYLDSNVLAGRTRFPNQHTPLPCLKEHRFLPVPPKKHLDLIYLCSPHNPTGSAFTKKELQAWIQYAKKEHAIILYDGAYSAFIRDPSLPVSIFEIPDAKKVAIEFRSFSKTAGFSGMRLSYIAFSKTLTFDGICLHALWKRKIDTTFGGVSYPIQKGGAAVYTEKAQKELQKNISIYLENALLLKKGLKNLGFHPFGGTHSPYVWCPTKPLSSSEFFDLLLEKAHIISIPGHGFGKQGEGFCRFSSFAKKEDIQTALKRLQQL